MWVESLNSKYIYMILEDYSRVYCSQRFCTNKGLRLRGWGSRVRRDSRFKGFSFSVIRAYGLF